MTMFLIKYRRDGQTYGVHIPAESWVAAAEHAVSLNLVVEPCEVISIERAEATTFRMPDQRSLTDQLEDLIPVANKMGLYDAADFLTNKTQG